MARNIKKANPVNQMIAIVIFIVLIILITAAVKLLGNKKPVAELTQPTAEVTEEKKCEVRSPLDGVCDKEGQLKVAAVMIDNHGDAQPTFGVNDASVVYETIAELPITRWVAVFDLRNSVSQIGPIRSARPYYVDWASEYRGVYAHVGGSDESLALLKNRPVDDLNEFYNDKYFWRDNGRLAPHNTFISTNLLNKAIDDKGWTTGTFDSWKFKDDMVVDQRPEAQQILVDYKSNLYNVTWEYDRTDNMYTRKQLGAVRTDGAGQAIKAKNVIVMIADSDIIDSYGRRSTQTIGTGQAEICRDGVVIAGTWSRPTLKDRTKFFDTAGQEVELNAGLTWINVVPSHFPGAIIK
jgi:hypothetical protein